MVRAIKYLERMLVQAQAEKQRRKADSTKACPDDFKENEDEDKGISIDPKTYCKLGHFHLLLEDYGKGIASFLYYFCHEIAIKIFCIFKIQANQISYLSSIL